MPEYIRILLREAHMSDEAIATVQLAIDTAREMAYTQGRSDVYREWNAADDAATLTPVKA